MSTEISVSNMSPFLSFQLLNEVTVIFPLHLLLPFHPSKLHGLCCKQKPRGTSLLDRKGKKKTLKIIKCILFGMQTDISLDQLHLLKSSFTEKKLATQVKLEQCFCSVFFFILFSPGDRSKEAYIIAVTGKRLQLKLDSNLR